MQTQPLSSLPCVHPPLQEANIRPSSEWNKRQMVLIAGLILTVASSILLVTFPPTILLAGIPLLAAKIILIASITGLTYRTFLCIQLLRINTWERKLYEINQTRFPMESKDIEPFFNKLHKLGPPPTFSSLVIKNASFRFKNVVQTAIHNIFRSQQISLQKDRITTGHSVPVDYSELYAPVGFLP